MLNIQWNYELPPKTEPGSLFKKIQTEIFLFGQFLLSVFSFEKINAVLKNYIIQHGKKKCENNSKDEPGSRFEK